MAVLPDSVLGTGLTSNYTWELLEELVTVNRMAGHQGEADGARVLESAFESVGLRAVERNDFSIPGWWRGSSGISLSRGWDRDYTESHEVIGLPGTSSGTISGRVVDVGYGRPADFDEVDVADALVMASSESPPDHSKWIHRMEKYSEAVHRGAAGFVFSGHLDGCLPPTGEIGYRNRPSPIPGVGVSKEVGHDLKRFAETDEPIAELTVDCRHEETTSQNVEGVVGPDTDRELLVTAHIDAHDISQGAGDNGVGCALIAEVGRLLHIVEDRLETAVRFVGFGAEEMGLRGAHEWTQRNDLDNVIAVLNIDGVGTARRLEVNSNGFDELGRAFERVGEALGFPVETVSNVSPHGDQWEFVQEGIPGAMIGTTSDGGRGWGHTHADTLDKIDSRNLREFAVVIAAGVLTLSNRSPALDPTTPAAIREQLDAGYVRELRVSDRWPWPEA